MRLDLPLHRGRLVARRKRFLADVVLDDGRDLTAHCPNSGAMTGLDAPGSPVIVSDSGNPARKLRFTLERVRAGRAWVGVNTMLPNRLAREAVERGRIPALRGPGEVRTEVVLEPGTRIDLRLGGGRGAPPDSAPCWVEVKSVTLREGREALFPDAVTERGLKHLEALTRAVGRGERAAMLYVVNRADCDVFAPAESIDPAYAAALRAAARAGVLVLAHEVRMRGPRVWLAGALPVRL